MRNPTARKIKAAAREKGTRLNKMQRNETLSRQEFDELIAAAKMDSDMKKMQLTDSFIMESSLSNFHPDKKVYHSKILR
jgi:hypothetical protein